MNRVFLIILTLVSITVGLFSCDEGRIYEDMKPYSEEGFCLNVTAEIYDVATWPASYTVSIAAFEEGNDYAVISKSIGTVSDQTGKYEMTITNIPANASTVEICVVNRLRQKIVSLYSIPLQTSLTEINIPETLNANMFDVIQNRIFSPTCANCHGASTFAAANLYLTDGKSYENLVNQASQVAGNGSLRVKPGSRSQSILYNILTGDISSSWNYDHSSEINDYNLLELIGSWIDNGAQN